MKYLIGLFALILLTAGVVVDEDILSTIYNQGEKNAVFMSKLPGTLSKDHTISGETKIITFGEDVVFGKVCYISSGLYYIADASDQTKRECLIVACDDYLEKDTGVGLVSGYVRDDSWSFTSGDDLYLSTVAGDITATEPTAAGEAFEHLGFALTADIIHFEQTTNGFPATGVFSHIYVDFIHANDSTYTLLEDDIALDYGEYFYLLHNGWTALDENDNYRIYVDSNQDFNIQFYATAAVGSWNSIFKYDESASKWIMDVLPNISGDEYVFSASTIDKNDASALVFGGTASKIEFNSLIDTDNNWISGDGGAAEGIQVEDDGDVNFSKNINIPTTTSTVGSITQNGSRILHSAHANTNIFVGVLAGNYTLTGGNNVVVGTTSGYALTTGNANVFVGKNAGRDNTVGHNNMYLGQLAGYENVDGNYNVAVGSRALQGVAGNSNSYNVGIGYQAGQGITTGQKNIFIGYGTGSATTTGDSNILIGDDVEASAAGASDELNIGDVIYGDLSSGVIAIPNDLTVDDDLKAERYMAESTTIAASSDAVDVTHCSVLIVNTAGGAITIGGFVGGADNQILYFYNLSTNNIIIEDDEGTGNQDIKTNTGGDITIFSEGGGLLVYNSSTGFWYLLNYGF